MKTRRHIPRRAATFGLAGGLSLGALLALVPMAAASAKSASVQQSTSENWAGYVVTTTRGSGSYSSVSGSWVQPAAKAGSGDAYSAFWVGLGGATSTSQSLEQVGTEVNWINGQAVYSAWYELVPAGSVRLSLTIHAGDRIFAKVTVSGTNVTVLLADRTTGASVTKTLQMSAPDTSSAEWVAEAPSESTPSGGYQTLPLADFGTVTFTSATATSDGHTGSISDARWSVERVQLTSLGVRLDAAYPGAPGATASQTSAGAARTSSLSGNGRRFSVAWQSSAGGGA